MALPGEHDFDVYGDRLAGESLDQAFAAIGSSRPATASATPSSSSSTRPGSRSRAGSPRRTVGGSSTTAWTITPGSARTARTRPRTKRDCSGRPTSLSSRRKSSTSGCAAFDPTPCGCPTPATSGTSPVCPPARPARSQGFHARSSATTAPSRPGSTRPLSARRRRGTATGRSSSSAIREGRNPKRSKRSKALPNVRLAGEVPYSELPAFVAAFDVCTIPFLRTPLTEATNPVKIFEYFATGKPVVARRLPEIEAFADVITLYDSPAEFVSGLEQAVRENVTPGPGAERRRALARQNTWQARYQVLKARLDSLSPKTRAESREPASGSPTPASPDAVARRAKEIRRLAGVIRERDEGIAFLRREAAGHEKAFRARIQELESALAQTEATSEARGTHLAAAMEELDRWERSRLGQLRRAIARGRALPGSARRALGRATAPGTPFFGVARRVLPRPVAQFLRRTLAPVEQPDKLVNDPGQRGAHPERRPGQAVRPLRRGRLLDHRLGFPVPATPAARHAVRPARPSGLLSLDDAVPGAGRPGLGPDPEGGERRRAPPPLAPRPRHLLRPSRPRGPRHARGLLRGARARTSPFGDTVCLVQIPVLGARSPSASARSSAGASSTTAWTSGRTFRDSGRACSSLEENLVRRADVTVVSADRLLEKWKAAAPRLVLAKNGIDAEHYRQLYGENALLAGASPARSSATTERSPRGSTCRS